MLIELKGNNYYSKVFKRINYKLSNSTFWVVINGHESKICNYGKEIGRAGTEETTRSTGHFRDTSEGYVLFHMSVLLPLSGGVSNHSSSEKNVWWSSKCG